MKPRVTPWTVIMNDEETIEVLMTAARDLGYGRIPQHQVLNSYAIGAFDLISPGPDDPAGHFRMLTEICQRYDETKADEQFLSGYIYLLEQLVNAAGTTEIPPGMMRILEDNPQRTETLRSWYRIA